MAATSAASAQLPGYTYSTRWGQARSVEQLAKDSFLSIEQVNNLLAHFNYADRDRSGTLERNELEALWANAFKTVWKEVWYIMQVVGNKGFVACQP